MAIWDQKILTTDLPVEERRKMVGPIPEIGFESNGCSFVPDSYGDLHMDAPCHWHDWAYHLGGGWVEFWAANTFFRRNLRNVDTPRLIAWARWAAVSTAGIPFFSWKKNPPYLVEQAALGACMLMKGNPREVGAHKESK